MSTGWFDDGLKNGQNKLVPAITFKLKNVSDQKLSVIQVNVLFKQVDNPAEWGSGLLSVVGSKGLASDHGYTGEDARQDMLKNSQFVDARIEFSAKYGAVQWTRLADFPVTRTLIAN